MFNRVMEEVQGKKGKARWNSRKCGRKLRSLELDG